MKLIRKPAMYGLLFSGLFLFVNHVLICDLHILTTSWLYAFTQVGSFLGLLWLLVSKKLQVY